MPSHVPSYHGYRFPSEIISHAVWLYYRFALSFRDVEDLLAQRNITVTYETIRQWCLTAVEGLSGDQVGALIVAYEPVWAIGTGRTATPDQAQDAHAHLRREIERLAGSAAADRCRLLYGGSVKPGNVQELSARPDVDGALVGGSSLDPGGFAKIVAGGRPT